MKWIIYTLSLALTASLSALELQLPSIFADQMVLQREQSVPVWGTVDAGAHVSVMFGGQTKQVTADTQGKWRIDLDSMNASAESRELTIKASLGSESTELTMHDVLVGEVWFAGGQSNMYRPFRMQNGPAKDPFYEPVTEYMRQEAATANDPLFRQYRAGVITTPFKEDVKGRGNWSKAIPGQVNEFCCTAYFFGRELRKELDVPVALISCNKGATRIEPWIAPAAYATNDVLKKDYDQEVVKLKERMSQWDDAAEREKYQKAIAERKKAEAEGRKVAKKGPRKPVAPENDIQAYGSLFNGMVAPIAPYAMKGAIWYQGESNSGNFPDQYDIRLAALIEGWREAWGQEKFFFFWCQLANYKAVNEEPLDEVDGWVLVQNAMRRGLRVPDTGMAVLNDIGEAGDIHPKNKLDAGKRLSLWALSKAYAQEDLVYSGPLYKEAKVSGNKVFIKFDHVGSGLMVGHKHLMNPTVEVDEPLKRFQICGSDGVWKWADAKIQMKDTVVVSHKDIPNPVEVRYAWSPNPQGANLYNKEGLPTSVFKTGKL